MSDFHKIDISEIKKQADNFLKNMDQVLKNISNLPTDQREKVKEVQNELNSQLQIMKNEFNCK